MIVESGTYFNLKTLDVCVWIFVFQIIVSCCYVSLHVVHVEYDMSLLLGYRLRRLMITGINDSSIALFCNDI